MTVAQKRRQFFLRLEVLDELLGPDTARRFVADRQHPPRIAGNHCRVFVPQIQIHVPRQHLRSTRDVYVNVACGPQVLPGYVNLDLRNEDPTVITCDARRRVPIGDEAARGIRAEQFVEHLETQEELPSFLADCRRALAPGGVLRIIVPDTERYLQAYCRGDLSGFWELEVPNPFPADLPTRMDIINHVFHQWHEHRWAYDFETLVHRLNAAGFTRVERSAYLQSRDPKLAQDRDVHAPYSLYVEAIK